MKAAHFLKPLDFIGSARAKDVLGGPPALDLASYDPPVKPHIFRRDGRWRYAFGTKGMQLSALDMYNIASASRWCWLRNGGLRQWQD